MINLGLPRKDPAECPACTAAFFRVHLRLIPCVRNVVSRRIAHAIAETMRQPYVVGNESPGVLLQDGVVVTRLGSGRVKDEISYK